MHYISDWQCRAVYVYLCIFLGYHDDHYHQPAAPFLGLPRREDHSRSTSPLGYPPLLPPHGPSDHWSGAVTPPRAQVHMPPPLPPQELSIHGFMDRDLERRLPPSPPPPPQLVVNTVPCEKILDLPGRSDRPSHVSSGNVQL